jgi:site-specific DNA recombinase
MGIPTAQGGHKWIGATIRRMLDSETYCGVWHYGKRSKKKLYPVEVPAIVSREIWEAAQNRFAKNKKHSKRNRKYDYLVTTRCTCGHCGYSIVGRASKSGKKGKLYFYYHCPSDREERMRNCDLPNFRVDKVDSAVWNWIKSLLEDEDFLNQSIEEYQADQAKKNEPLQNQLEAVNQQIDEHNKDLDNQLATLSALKDRKSERAQAVILNDIERIESTLDRLEKRQNELQEQLNQDKFTSNQILGVKQFATKIRDGLHQADKNFEARLMVVKMLDLKVILKIEDGKKIAYAQCRLGDENLPIDSCPKTGPMV